MTEKVTLELSNEEALVLFEWIKRFNEKENQEFEDQAEERVLWNLEAMLEKNLKTPFEEEYKKLLKEARDRIRDKE
jgi:asparagine synthetase B (glutamine-hydrolysing)